MECSKLALNWKMAMMLKFFEMASSSDFLTVFFVSLVNFEYYSKFHVNIITGFGVMTVSFYKGLTRNPEIGNNIVWVLPNIRRLALFRNTKIDTNVPDKMLLNAANCQGYSFSCFWVFKGKLTEWWGKVKPLPSLIRVM